MRIGIIGAGHIGGNAADLWVKAGHEVMLSFSRDTRRLEALAAQLGPRASVGTPAEAASFGEVVMLSVPWRTIGDALRQAGSLAGKTVIDTTNQFGSPAGEIPPGMTAVRFNQGRMPGAHVVKAYNTLTSGFQHSAAGRHGPDRVVMFMCGDDPGAKQVVAQLIEDSGFTPIDVGGLDDATPMEAPRRPGAVYGEEFHEDTARAFLAQLAAGR